METFSVLLAIYAGNSPITGEFHAQMPVTRSFGVFFDLRLNKRLSNIKNREVDDLRRHRTHYDVIVMTIMDELGSPSIWWPLLWIGYTTHYWGDEYEWH